ncbi:MAG: SDR family oxidoreductase [Phycisphaeraceae bacterium]
MNHLSPLSSEAPPIRNPKSEIRNPKVALVTGGAKRVGRAVALTLAQAGMDIAITYRRSADEAKQVVRDIEALGRRALAIRVDLAKADAAERVYAAFTRRFDRLDALINNASVFAAARLGSITPADLESQWAVNARAPMLLIQRFAPMLAAHADVRHPATLGRIVNFIDIHVMGQPLRGYLPYNMSKAALMELTMTAAMELAPQVTVNAIAPGVVAWADAYTPAMKQAYLKRVPLARPGTPHDAAAAVLFLVRDAHYCTGQIIRLDGGRLLT